jgi:dUTPase
VSPHTRARVSSGETIDARGVDVRARRVVVLAPGRRRRVGVGVDFVCPRETVLGENLRFFGDAGRLDGA